MFQTFNPKKRKIIACDASAPRNTYQVSSNRISKIHQALLDLELNIVPTEINAKKFVIRNQKLYEQCNITSFFIKNVVTHNHISIEGNFDLQPFLHVVHDFDDSRTFSFHQVNCTISQKPNWLYPTLINSALFHDVESIPLIRKLINRKEYWPSIDLEIKPNDSTIQIEISNIKSAIQKWQEALLSIFDLFLNIETTTFQILGDSSASNPSMNNVKSINASAIFYYNESIPYCIIVGASKAFIKRLLTLGAAPSIMFTPEELERNSKTSSQSTSGKFMQIMAGRNLHLSGKSSLSVVIHCLLEQVFFPNGPTSSNLFVEQLPIIHASMHFRHAVPSFMNIRALQCHHDFSCTTNTNNSSHKVLIAGDINASALFDLSHVLIQLARTPTPHNNIKTHSGFEDVRTMVASMLQFEDKTSSQHTANTKNTSENFNPIAAVTIKSQFSRPTAVSTTVSTASNKPLSEEDEASLSSEQWLQRVKGLGNEVKYFILRPTGPATSTRLKPFAYTKGDEIINENGISSSSSHDINNKESIRVLKGHDVIEEIRWHSLMSSYNTNRCDSGNGELVYVIRRPTPSVTLRAATIQDTLQQHAQQLDSDATILEPLNAYSKFVENKIM